MINPSILDFDYEFPKKPRIIHPLAWSPDNQRIVVVGEGREKFGHVFLADTGTSNGDVSGQTRPINSCDFKPSRPFRIITGSEDNTVAYYEGPPFKFKGLRSEHSRYCQSVRYSPDGVFWASAGFDGKIFLYEGKESELITEFLPDGKNAHAGGIYAIAWGSNNKSLLSASGDKTCKLWDVENHKPVTTFVMGDEVEDQQLGCLWSGDFMISVSLSGYINYLDARTPRPVRVVKGHNKPITKMIKDKDAGTLVTSGSDGRVIAWDVVDGSGSVIEGEGHNCQVNGLHRIHGTKVGSVGIDDTLKYFDLDLKKFSAGDSVKLSSQPKSVAHFGSVTAVVTVEGVVVLRDGSVALQQKLDFEPGCVALKSETEMSIGEASAGFNLNVYEISGDSKSINLTKTVHLSGAVTDIAYSPNGAYVVTADANRKVTLFDANYEKAHAREWGFHTAKVTCVAWSPDSRFVASGGLDCAIIIWNVASPEKHTITQSAHVQSQINALTWLDNKSVASSGQDGNVKVWDVEIK